MNIDPEIVNKAPYFQENNRFLSTLLLHQGNCFERFIEKLKTFSNWILSCFSFRSRSNDPTHSITSSGLQNTIDFGNRFITHILQEEEARWMADLSCKLGIVVKLNQEIISQHLTVICIPTLAASREIAVAQLTYDLERYFETHPSSNGFRVEAYFLKSTPTGACDIEYRFDTQNSGPNGRDHSPGLTRSQATEYLIAKYGISNALRDNFLRFMVFNA